MKYLKQHIDSFSSLFTIVYIRQNEKIWSLTNHLIVGFLFAIFYLFVYILSATAYFDIIWNNFKLRGELQPQDTKLLFATAQRSQSEVLADTGLLCNPSLNFPTVLRKLFYSYFPPVQSPLQANSLYLIVIFL